MPGRPRTMARKVAELEGAILDLYRRLDAAIPATHKQATAKCETLATGSPWTKLHRAACGLVVAGSELGDYYRRTTGSTEPGPIQDTLGDDGLQSIRRQAVVGDAALNDAETRLDATLRAVADKLPDRASIQSEVEWVGANLHDPQPAFDKAPSRTAVNLWLDVCRDERLRRDFWTILLGRRLSPGEPKPTAFANDADRRSDDRDDEEIRRELFGP